MRSFRTYWILLSCVLVLNAVTALSADVSILLQDGGVQSRRHDRGHERDRYRRYPYGYREELYSPAYSQPGPYVLQSIPDNSPRDLTLVSMQLYDVKQLLDQKGRDGFITQEQLHAEASYLAEIDQDAHAHAFEQGGRITADQEAYYLQHLQQTKLAINQNLIVH